MKERINQNFDSFAETYREEHTKSIRYVSGTDSFYFAEYKVKELLSFEVNVDADVLDLGCGDGATELFFQKYFPSFKVTGIDISAKSIEVAKKRELKNVDFQVYDGGQIPFENNRFDVVFVAGVLHHIDELKQQAIVNELFRVIKPGGRLYLFEHNPLNPLTRYLVNICEFDKGVKLLYSKKSANLLRGSGFHIHNVNFAIFFPRSNFFRWLISLEKFLRKIPFGGQYYIRAIKD